MTKELSPEELNHAPAVYDRAIQTGMTPEQADAAVLESIFGVGFERDPKTGKPIENGIGSAKHPTPNHRLALEKAEGRK